MKIKILFLFVIVSLSANGQRDVVKFLGIPVDGTKSEMIKKLESKGFEYNKAVDFLTGQFNDYDVDISVVTNNNKVSRILVADRIEVDETSIRIRFNRLCKQFERNSKYISVGEQTIPDDEDISYNMGVKNKRYEAVFYQKPLTLDTLSIQQELKDILHTKYSDEYIENHPEEIVNEADSIAKEIAYGLIKKRPVWFMIKEKYAKYYIVMFYDNEYNRSDGEDL